MESGRGGEALVRELRGQVVMVVVLVVAVVGCIDGEARELSENGGAAGDADVENWMLVIGGERRNHRSGRTNDRGIARDRAETSGGNLRP